MTFVKNVVILHGVVQKSGQFCGGSVFDMAVELCSFTMCFYRWLGACFFFMYSDKLTLLNAKQQTINSLRPIFLGMWVGKSAYRPRKTRQTKSGDLVALFGPLLW